MTKRFGLSDALRMVADTKRLIADGMTAEDAAIKAGFTGYAQYYAQAKRLGAMEDTGERPIGWEKEYIPQPLPDAPEPPETNPEILIRADVDFDSLMRTAESMIHNLNSDPVDFDLRPDPHASYRILLEQMQIVQALSRTCIVPADMAILSDALIRLAEEITD